MGRDQGWFAVFGRGILDGYKPYLDFWDTKPPGIFYTYAATFAVFGKNESAVRVLDIVCAVPVALLLFSIVSRLGRWRGLIAGLGFFAFYFSETFWTLSQADGLALLPLALSAWCALTACDRAARPWRWLFLSGVAAGIAIWFKYSFALIAVVIVVGLLINSFKKSVVKPTLVFALGIIVVLVIGLIFLAHNGILPATIESARVAGQYAMQDYGNGRWLQSTVWIAGVNERIARWWPLLILAALWWTLRLRSLTHLPLGEEQDERVPVSAMFWLWLVAALLNVLIQAKGFGYHWLPMLPPLLMLAADAVVGIIEWVSRLSITTHIAIAGVCVALIAMLAIDVALPSLPYLLGQQSRADYDARFTAGEFSAVESARMAAFLRAHVALGDTLFIWGSRPEIYFQSNLRPATRFISHTILSATWTQPTWRKENVDVLWAAMPPVALVLQGDYFPWVTGNNNDSATLLQGYTELNNWLIANYERDGLIGNFLIWKRK